MSSDQNTILIKTGKGAPEASDLAYRELGYDKKNNRLFIGGERTYNSDGSIATIKDPNVLSPKVFIGNVAPSNALDGDLWIDTSAVGITTMVGATSTADGAEGLVPAPAKGKQAQYLRGDGTWHTPTNTTYEVATTKKNGLMSSLDKKKLDKVIYGAWTPVVKNAASTSIARGSYIKIGNYCVISFMVAGTGYNSSTTSSDYYFEVTGDLPTPSSSATFYGGGGHAQGLRAASATMHFSGFTLYPSGAIFARTLDESTPWGGDYAYIANGGNNFYVSGTIMYTTTG